MNPDEATEARTRVQGLFLAHSEVVRGFIHSLLPDRAMADDALQETFLTVMDKAESFTPGTNFIRWACTVARYKVLEARRSRDRTGLLLSEEALDALASSDTAPAEDLRFDFLIKCVDALTPTMRRLIELRYEGDHKPTEIARVVGWTVDAVHVALSRARVVLRNCVEIKMKEAEARP